MVTLEVLILTYCGVLVTEYFEFINMEDPSLVGLAYECEMENS